MKNLISILTALIICAAGNRVHAQLNITPSNNATALAQAITGKGVKITNAKFTGNATAGGTFTNSNTNDLGIASGIILSTGNTATINNKASFFSSTPHNPVPGGDADLTTIVGSQTYDGAVLEFDFTAVGDSILVNFVFGSEEYPNYNCTNYNDAFAFLISGPGYTGKKNIALVPGTTIPVSINSINDGTSNGSNTACVNLGPGSPFTGLFVNNNGNQNVAFNGYTKVLTAKAKVQPCQTYHIKLAIADVADNIYDSGVFIEGNSFKSNVVTLSLDAFIDITEGTFLVEGCKPGSITFKRLCDDDGSQALNVQLTVTGTAVGGTDYKALPLLISMAPGELSKTYAVDVVDDHIPEGTETIILNFKNLNTGEVGTPQTILVKDKAIFHKNINDFVCSAIGKTLTAQKVDTTTNKYLWSTGATSQTIPISQAGTYVVEHQFAQNCTNIDSFFIVSGDPVFNIGPDTAYCAYDSVFLDAQVPAAKYVWNTKQTTQQIYATTAGLYWVRVTTPNGCFISDSLIATHKVVPAIYLGNDTALCAYESVYANATFAGANYIWNDGFKKPLRLVDTAGTYSVELELNGCYFRDTLVVTDKRMPVVDAGKDVIIPTTTAITLEGKDDPANAAYKWSPNVYLNNNRIPKPVSFPLNDVNYVLEVTSADGCVLTDTMKIWIEDLLHIPNAFSPNADGINDNWIIPILPTYTKAVVEVYSRYGQIVYRSIGYDKPWTGGTTTGQPLPVGTYYYYINPNNGKKIKTGWVQVLR
jgi:gliding motility-associated-like protein